MLPLRLELVLELLLKSLTLLLLLKLLTLLLLPMSLTLLMLLQLLLWLYLLPYALPSQEDSADLCLSRPLGPYRPQSVSVYPSAPVYLDVSLSHPVVQSPSAPPFPSASQ